MFKFFRKIRYKFISENKTSRYLKYALGEIILVVIGILIALQVNNWNAERQMNQTGKKLLKNIQKDLLTDIESAGDILETYLTKDSLARLVINNKLQVSDYQNSIYGPKGTYFDYWYDNFVINKQSYLKFKDFAKDLNDPLMNLQDAMDNLYIFEANYIDKFNNRLSNTVYDNINYLATNKSWYYQWFYGKEEITDADNMFQFFLNDPEYKNQVASYINDYKNLNRGTQTFRVQAVSLFEKINEVLDEKLIERNVLELQKNQDAIIEHYLGSYSIENNNKNTCSIYINKDDDYLHRKDEDDETYILYRHSDTDFFMFKQNEVEVLKFNLNDDQNATTLEITAKHDRKTYLKIYND